MATLKNTSRKKVKFNEDFKRFYRKVTGKQRVTAQGVAKFISESLKEVKPRTLKHQVLE